MMGPQQQSLKERSGKVGLGKPGANEVASAAGQLGLEWNTGHRPNPLEEWVVSAKHCQEVSQAV